jgi:hypothetical protein
VPKIGRKPLAPAFDVIDGAEAAATRADFHFLR